MPGEARRESRATGTLKAVGLGSELAHSRNGARAKYGSSENTSSTQRENPMGEIIDKVKGKIKQVAGALTGDKKLVREGKADEAKGNVKGAVENVKHAVKETMNK
jgi:uncharacterized protein YjbJ (UPF0337 family)